MAISMDEVVRQMKLTTLADLSTHELQQHRCKEPFDDRYCVEILRRALKARSPSDLEPLPFQDEKGQKKACSDRLLKWIWTQACP